MTKKCFKCGVIKDITMYFIDRNSKSGRRGDCKPCNIKSTNKWRKANIGKVRKRERTYKKSPVQKLRSKRLSAKNRDDLSDMYIRSLIVKKDKNLKSSDVSDELVELWRLNLKLKRLLRKN